MDNGGGDHKGHKDHKVRARFIVHWGETWGCFGRKERKIGRVKNHFRTWHLPE